LSDLTGTVITLNKEQKKVMGLIMKSRQAASRGYQEAVQHLDYTDRLFWNVAEGMFPELCDYHYSFSHEDQTIHVRSKLKPYEKVLRERR